MSLLPETQSSPPLSTRRRGKGISTKLKADLDVMMKVAAKRGRKKVRSRIQKQKVRKPRKVKSRRRKGMEKFPAKVAVRQKTPKEVELEELRKDAARLYELASSFAKQENLLLPKSAKDSMINRSNALMDDLVARQQLLLQEINTMPPKVEGEGDWGEEDVREERLSAMEQAIIETLKAQKAGGKRLRKVLSPTSPISVAAETAASLLKRSAGIV